MPKKRGRSKKEIINELVNELYLASIKVLGVVYHSTSATKDAAITNLKVPKGLGVSVLTVSKGSKSQEKILNGIQTSRLFSASPNVRMYALKNTCSRFDL